MPVKVSVRDGAYRVVEADTGRIARSTKGNAADGGGHGRNHAKAYRQASAINMALAAKQPHGIEMRHE